MKKYVLKKDLPTFKKGDTFVLEGDGCLYLENKRETDWSSRVMAYHWRTLEAFPNILGEWFEEILDGKTPHIDKEQFHFLLVRDESSKVSKVFGETTIWAKTQDEATETMSEILSYGINAVINDPEK